jgi:hypothetical protein
MANIARVLHQYEISRYLEVYYYYLLIKKPKNNRNPLLREMHMKLVQY